MILRSAIEIPRAYRTRLNVSLEKRRERNLSLLPPLLFATLVPSDARISRMFETRVRSLTFACYYAAI